MSSSFAVCFREHVIPALIPQLRWQALRVKHEVCLFSDAVAEIWAIACQRGATHLPDWAIRHLDDWIAKGILETIVEIESDDTGQIALGITSKILTCREIP
jgi:hypothetical protein